MEHGGRTPELVGRAAGTGLESVAAWMEANRRLWREWMQLSADAARENVRFAWEVQSGAWQLFTAPAARWTELQRETLAWYETAMREGLERLERTASSLAEDGDRTGTRGARGRELLRERWRDLRGRIRQQWGKLTDEELDQVQGNAEALVGKLQEHYGRSREQVEDELDRWLDRQRLARAS